MILNEKLFREEIETQKRADAKFLMQPPTAQPPGLKYFCNGCGAGYLLSIIPSYE